MRALSDKIVLQEPDDRCPDRTCFRIPEKRKISAVTVGIRKSKEAVIAAEAIDNGQKFTPVLNSRKKYKVQGKRKMLIKPSKKSLSSIKDTIHRTVLDNGLGMTQDELIRILNPKIRGWCNYHRSAVSSHTFNYIYSYTFRILFRWGERRHSKKGRKWIANKYWHPKGRRKWVFCTECRTLLSANGIKIVRHGMVRNKMNPYIDTEYYSSRQRNRKYERGYRDKDIAM